MAMRELRPRIVRDLKLLPSITGVNKATVPGTSGRREVTILRSASPSPGGDAREILTLHPIASYLPSSISISADSVGLCVRMGHAVRESHAGGGREASGVTCKVIGRRSSAR